MEFKLYTPIDAGVYILQNTMVVGGGGEWLLEKKIKTEVVGKKLKKGKEKGEKRLKNAKVKNSKI